MPTDVSGRTRYFTESVIREMTRRALKCGAVNLAQGFPDFAAPVELKEAAKRAIDEDYNQYAITHGSPNFRAAIAQKARSYNGLECDPDRHVTVTCGATEAMIASLIAVINTGRRDRHFRALLRELWSGRDYRRGNGELRCAA
jgi:L-glutamine---4-(methylsulfanyl)-2-oxobutanoate aminotransferase